MKKERKKKIYEDDDGRVIAPMNVDGMPWVDKKQNRFDGFDKTVNGAQNDIQLTKKETRAMMRGIFAAAMLVAGVFALAALLFVLFCVHVWLK